MSSLKVYIIFFFFGILFMTGLLFQDTSAQQIYLSATATGSTPPKIITLFENTDCTVPFIMEETLSNPTQQSMMVSLIPNETTLLYVEYGFQSGSYTHTTAPQYIPAGAKATFTLGNLIPGKRHYYRVQCKRPNDPSYVPREEYTFRTLRQKGSSFSFIISADSHLYAQHSKANPHDECSTGASGYSTAITSLAYFNQSMANFKDPSIDFFVMGGDESMTHCKGCLPCSVHGESAGSGTVQSLREAELRYDLVLSPEYYGKVTKYLPVFYKLGNHDGEPGFSDAAGSCDNHDQLLQYSRTARLEHLPNPLSVYPGGNNGGYFVFTSGDALFVVLDVMNGPTGFPQTADDWTLGPTQLTWFKQVLKQSNKQWTFVFAEHLVGGMSDPAGHCYYYGRGGLKATDNEEINGTFLGEQAYLHDLMVAANVTAFFTSHDHVSMIGEKKDQNNQGEGVLYATSGKSSNIAGPWISQSWFQDQMDYDNNNLPDYIEGIWGSDQSGFYRVDVNKDEDVVISYILNDYQNPLQNALPIFSYTVYANGSNTLPLF